MSGFKAFSPKPIVKEERFQVHNDQIGKTQEVNKIGRIVKQDFQTTIEVSEYSFPELKKSPFNSYKDIQKSYGNLAVTDKLKAGKEDKKNRDSRFYLSPLVRDPLAIEEEEKRALEERVRAEVQKILSMEQEAARKKGYEDGYQKAYVEQKEKFEEEGRLKLENFNALVQQIENSMKEIYEANEKYLIDLVFRIAKTLILRDVKEDKDYILRLTRELIEKAGAKENFRVRISDIDFQTATSLKTDLEKEISGLRHFSIEPSSNLEPGSCVVETDWNKIESHLELQLESVRNSLLGERANDQAT